MMRRARLAAVLLVLALTLTGCVMTREDCEAQGGEWRETTVLIPQYVGKTPILIPHRVHTCETP